MLYGKNGNPTHIALYYGKFSSAKKVKNFLEKKGYVKKGAIKKVSKNKYTYRGRTIIRRIPKVNTGESIQPIVESCSIMIYEASIHLPEALANGAGPLKRA